MTALPLSQMLALARRYPAEHVHRIDLPYRFSSWALDEPANAAWWGEEDSARVSTGPCESVETLAGSPGQLRAWAVLQAPFWTIDCACDPAAEDELYPRILEWADRRMRQVQGTGHERPAWFVNVFAHQAGRRRTLEAAGFAEQTDVGEDSWSKVWMRRLCERSGTFAESNLPAGFTIRPLAGKSEVPAYVTLHQAVFESKNMTVEWRARTLDQPAYRPDLDLFAVAPDGRQVGFCILWQDGDTGQVEPLGVHPDFRRLGLGRALLAEGLRRLHANGARQVYVETDNDRNAALETYEAAGFRVVEEVLVYRKDM
jgi:mycothiol synthase